MPAVAIATCWIIGAGCGNPSVPDTSGTSGGVSDRAWVPEGPPLEGGNGGGDNHEDEGGCPSILREDLFPRWRVTLSGTEWAALEDEFLHRFERQAAGLPLHPYHPIDHITFDAGNGEVAIDDAMIRLKGQSSWVQTIELDPYPKMQFVIAFNEIDPDGRFAGVRKVELDMPRSDWTFLRQRLALHIMRLVGQDAQCANSAELYINGEYYGLYTHLERIDKEFLQRVYGKENGADDGDLWKSGSLIETNEDTATRDRIDALWGAGSVAELDALADLDEAVYEWAAEAVLPHADGFQIGHHNFFVYDHPERGFVWIPSDLDTVFDRFPYDLDPAFPGSWHDYSHWGVYLMTLADPAWMDRYVSALAAVRGGYDPADQVALIDEWAAQIESAAAADPHRPFSMGDHAWALDEMREYIDNRAEFIDDWLDSGRAGLCSRRDDDCRGFLDESGI